MSETTSHMDQLRSKRKFENTSSVQCSCTKRQKTSDNKSAAAAATCGKDNGEVEAHKLAELVTAARNYAQWAWKMRGWDGIGNIHIRPKSRNELRTAFQAKRSYLIALSAALDANIVERCAVFVHGKPAVPLFFFMAASLPTYEIARYINSGYNAFQCANGEHVLSYVAHRVWKPFALHNLAVLASVFSNTK
jgi:hypothetical protein